MLHQCSILMGALYSITHKGHTQMGYPFMYAPRLPSTSFSMYCVTPEAYINLTSCFALHKMRVEYSESENVKPDLQTSAEFV